MTLNLGQVQFSQIPKSSFWELCEVGAMQSTPLFAAVQDGAFRGSHIAIHQWSAQHGSTLYPLVSNQTLMEVTCECRSFDFDIFSPCTHTCIYHVYIYILYIYIYMYMTLVVAMPCLRATFFWWISTGGAWSYCLLDAETPCRSESRLLERNGDGWFHRNLLSNKNEESWWSRLGRGYTTKRCVLKTLDSLSCCFLSAESR